MAILRGSGRRIPDKVTRAGKAAGAPKSPDWYSGRVSASTPKVVERYSRQGNGNGKANGNGNRHDGSKGDADAKA
jgi:hypothetical protein